MPCMCLIFIDQRQTCIHVGKIIRIYHEYEGGKEKSILRITNWHHEFCQVMTKGDPKGSIYLSNPQTTNGLLFLYNIFYV